MEEKQTNQEKITQVAQEFIAIAEKYEITMVELDMATYQVRQYFTENATLKTTIE